MTTTTTDTNHNERDWREDIVIVGKYRAIGRQRAARSRAYAAAMALGAVA